MAELDFAALVRLLKGKDLNPCPACGHPFWLIGDGPLFVPRLTQDEGEASGFRAVALFCADCGLMHLHNFAVLEGDTEVLERTTKENEDADQSD